MPLLCGYDGDVTIENNEIILTINYELGHEEYKNPDLKFCPACGRKLK